MLELKGNSLLDSSLNSIFSFAKEPYFDVKTTNIKDLHLLYILTQNNNLQMTKLDGD